MAWALGRDPRGTFDNPESLAARSVVNFSPHNCEGPVWAEPCGGDWPPTPHGPPPDRSAPSQGQKGSKQRGEQMGL